MVNVKMYRQIQNLKRQGKSPTEICKELKINLKTASKYYQMSESAYRLYHEGHVYRDKILEVYEKDILQVYEENEFKKLNMSAVYDYLEERYGSLPCNEKTLRNYINYLIFTSKLKLDDKLRIYSKVPDLPLGKQMQLDFGQYQFENGFKLYIFAAVLSASRYKYIIFQDHPFKTKEVILHLLDCFDYFGGIPLEMVIDQDKLMVVSENSGDIIFTRYFKYFIEELDIDMYVCRKADPESKGKIENVVKYVKINFLSIRNFNNLEEANRSVLKWLNRRANGKISQATRQIPAVLIENERGKLRPVLNSIFRKESMIGRDDRSVNEKGCISINACGYQLPMRYRNKKVEVYITKEKVFIFDPYSGAEVISYDLSLIPGKLISKRELKREKEKTVKELKTHVIAMYSEKKWKRFVENNFKLFSRFVRDQCIEAKRYFQKNEIDRLVLNNSLEYCLENNTLSFSNLNDTYNYFALEAEESKEITENDSTVVINQGYQGVHKPFRVASRDLLVYKDFISNSNRGN